MDLGDHGIADDDVADRQRLAEAGLGGLGEVRIGGEHVEQDRGVDGDHFGRFARLAGSGGRYGSPGARPRVARIASSVVL